MRRLDRAPERFDVLDLFARMARDGNLPFDEDSSQDEFARRVAASIGQAGTRAASCPDGSTS